jgi:hypothetical protein
MTKHLITKKKLNNKTDCLIKQVPLVISVDKSLTNEENEERTIAWNRFLSYSAHIHRGG